MINLSPSILVNGDVLEMVWSGNDISYSHLPVFGYKAFVYAPKEQKFRFDEKAILCIFLGYGSDEFGYDCGILKLENLPEVEIKFLWRSKLSDFEKFVKPQNTDIFIDLITSYFSMPNPDD